jgi:hypothetical protein
MQAEMGASPPCGLPNFNGLEMAIGSQGFVNATSKLLRKHPYFHTQSQKAKET